MVIRIVRIVIWKGYISMQGVIMVFRIVRIVIWKGCISMDGIKDG